MCVCVSHTKLETRLVRIGAETGWCEVKLLKTGKIG